MARGDHILRNSSNRPATGGGSRGNWPLWIVAIMVVLALFRWVGSDTPADSPVTEMASATIAAVAPPAAAAASASLPTPPPPLKARLAQFESTQHSSDGDGAALILGGGEYEITYETVDSASGIGDLAGASVFAMNFDNKASVGDPKNADVFVLFGSLKLKVADIDDNDALYASILSRADKVNAYFNFATSERGPPVDKKKRRVIVVGDLAEVALPAGFGNSTTTVDVLDLNPSESRQHDYDVALQLYQAKLYQFVASGGTPPLGDTPMRSPSPEFPSVGTHPDEFHPPAHEPPVFHPHSYEPPVFHAPPVYHPAPHPMRP